MPPAAARSSAWSFRPSAERPGFVHGNPPATDSSAQANITFSVPRLQSPGLEGGPTPRTPPRRSVTAGFGTGEILHSSDQILRSAPHASRTGKDRAGAFLRMTAKGRENRRRYFAQPTALARDGPVGAGRHHVFVAATSVAGGWVPAARRYGRVPLPGVPGDVAGAPLPTAGAASGTSETCT
jgi:hypothetical protein